MPWPSSETATVTPGRAGQRPPGGTVSATRRDRAALPAVFERVVQQVLQHLRHWSSSPATGGRSGGTTSSSRMPRVSTRGSNAAATQRTSSGSSTRSTGGWCSVSSIRDRLSRSSIRRFMRAPCSAMICRKRACAGGSSAAGPRRVSMKPIRLASGVRSSWLALATKSARIRSSARSRVRSDSTAAT